MVIRVIKNIWIVGIVLATGALVVPTANADLPNCYDEDLLKIPLVIDAVKVTTCIKHQDEFGEVGDQIPFGLFVSVPASTSVNITVGSPAATGCTIGTPVNSTTNSSAASSRTYFVIATTTDTTCFMYWQVTVVAGTTTVHNTTESATSFCVCTEAVTVTGNVNGNQTLTGNVNGNQTLTGNVNGTHTINGNLTLTGNVNNTCTGCNSTGGNTTVGNLTVTIEEEPVTPENDGILAALVVLLPIVLFLALLLWAELTKEFVIYLLTTIVGISVVLGLWDELGGIRFVLIAITLFCTTRIYRLWTETRDE